MSAATGGGRTGAAGKRTRRLAEPALDPAPRPPGRHLFVDLRPLQEPDRSPATADYLEALLGAYAADPLPDESVTAILQLGLPDPTSTLPALAGLPVDARRSLPPTRLLRSGALTTDPFLLRGASLLPGGGGALAAGRAVAPAVFHTASGSVPIASRLPVVVTLLDLAPWELPDAFGRTVAARFGHRLRARILRDAAAVIVTTEAAALGARRLLHVRSPRLRIVPLAPRPGFRRPEPGEPATVEATALELPARYLVHPGRFDARSDLAVLLGALGRLASVERPAALPADAPWPPRVVVVDASPDDRAEIARAAAAVGVGELLSYVPHLAVPTLAAVVAGARGVVLPLLSAASALPALEAAALGVPVVATVVGSLPEVVGAGGLLVRPRDEERLAVALATLWSDDETHARLGRAALEAHPTRTWREVAAETRAVYASVTTGGPR